MHHPGKWGRVAIINYIKPQLESHPSCCKDSSEDKGVHYTANLSDSGYFVYKTLLPTASRSEFRCVKRAATHGGGGTDQTPYRPFPSPSEV